MAEPEHLIVCLYLTTLSRKQRSWAPTSHTCRSGKAVVFTSTLRRTGTVLAVGALLFLGVPPAQAAVSPSATNAGAWLASQLTDGLVHNPNFGGFDDYGLSVDVLMALQEADTQGPKQDAIVSALRKSIKNYVFNFPSSGPADGIWSGSSAKALIAVQAAGKNGKSFGGVDLVATIEGTIEATGADKGRLKDQDIADFANPGGFVDYSNLLYQAYGLQGLAEARSAKVGDVRDFLLKQQCGPGYFRLYPGPCVVDVDATAIAIRAMSAAKADGVAGLDSALTKATAWLKKQQRSDGSFSGGASTPDPNTNSTGLAASALALRGNLAAARKAAAWTYRLQAGASSGAKLSKDAGAVALGPDQFAAGKKDGINDTTRAEWQRATAQAALALIYLDPTTIGTVTVINKTPKPVIRTASGDNPGAVVVAAGESTAPEAKTAAGKTGQYLAEQLSNGDHIEIKDGADTFVDYDLTADTALGLRLLGQQADFADRTTTFLLNKDSIDAYAHGAPYEEKAAYAEALAKLIVVAKTASKADPRALGDLAGELVGLQQPDGSFADRGKFADETDATKRQALASLALRMAGNDAAADKAVAFLVAAQCSDGGFPTQLGNGCATGDTQATGWALQALNAVKSADRADAAPLDSRPEGWSEDRTAAISSAVAALHKRVQVDGSVTAGSGLTDLIATSVVAAGRQSVGLDTHATAVFLGGKQAKDGGFLAAAGDKKSDLGMTAAVAPGLSSSWLSVDRAGLASAIALPLTEPAAVKKSPAVAKKSDDFTVSRTAAYTGMGILGLLLLGGLGWSAIRSGREARTQ